MLKRSKDLVQRVAESAGIVAPNVADATAAAERARAEMLAAQAALDGAIEALAAAEDRGAEAAKLTELEAGVVSARLTADRAQRRLQSSERRLASAVVAETGAAKAAAKARLDAALAKRRAAAERIDAAAFEIAEAAAILRETDGDLREGVRAGVVPSHAVGMISLDAIVQHAIEHAGAVRSNWMGEKSEQPTASALVSRIEGAVLAGI
jgi:hypothetical protein